MEIASLTKKSDFEHLAKHGRRFHSKSFRGQFLVVEGGYLLSPPRPPRLRSDGLRRAGEVDEQNTPLLKAAYAVQKKIFPKAVTRNRIKRRLRPALRVVVAEKVAGGKWFSDAGDVVPGGAGSSATIFLKIVPTSGIVDASYSQLCSELDLVLNQMLLRYDLSKKG